MRPWRSQILKFLIRPADISSPKTSEIRLLHAHQTPSSFGSLGVLSASWALQDHWIPGAPQSQLMSSSPGILYVPIFFHVFLFPALYGSSDDLKSSLNVLGHFPFAVGDSIPQSHNDEKKCLQSSFSPVAHLADSISLLLPVMEWNPDNATYLEALN